MPSSRRIVNDPRLRTLPMPLETPKTVGMARAAIEVDPLDERNLATLRDLFR